MRLAAAATPASSPTPSPTERLALQLSAEVDRWLTRRGLNPRTIGAPRATVNRMLKGERVTTESIADVADALNCDVIVTFHARAGSQVRPNRPYVRPAVETAIGEPAS
jgi:hypothetical protein